jgi:hypothetical protein
MNVPPINLFSPADWYRTIRDQIQHEDNLIVQRLSWLMAAQSFLFTGYAAKPLELAETDTAILAATSSVDTMATRRYCFRYE